MEPGQADYLGHETLDTFPRRVSAPTLDSDSEAAEPAELFDPGFPTEMTVYADTDSEGEPQVKTAAELWPSGPAERRKPRLPPLARRSRQASKESVASQSTCPGSSRQSSKESSCSWTPTATPDASMSLGSSDIDESEVTTLVVRNLPQRTTQGQFLGEVDRSGFAGAYDFAYLPLSIDGSHNCGHAFVNFRSPELAATFKAAWHFSARLGMSPGVALNVVAASAQGFHANAGRWTATRVARAKGIEFLPFVCQEPAYGADSDPFAEAVLRGSAWAGRFGDTCEATTLVVRNLSQRVTQQEFLDDINSSGFAGKYDFAYLPRSRDSGRGSGHAFVNFHTAEVASAFKAMWHRATRLSASPRNATLSVAASSVQGFHANSVKWTSARVARVKNLSFLPFMFEGSLSPHGPCSHSD